MDGGQNDMQPNKIVSFSSGTSSRLLGTDEADAGEAKAVMHVSKCKREQQQQQQQQQKKKKQEWESTRGS
jgi:hypothetical protein